MTNEIMKFYCGFCKDKIARTRKGFRDHLHYHIRNNFFNDNGVKNELARWGRITRKAYVKEEVFK